ncbi:MAG: polymerase III protein [candidate division WS6 bacterium GW2011_GWE1_34_7]|uniref:DNA polymerase III subunit delta n=1 Tax=candidate division WS6 bacterium GW2011_GWE1_34_7 TaxID=1619093 RepID=A0A0G0DT60_9BACT|nr:MAG: polymerase III protein [candidate division WS6 bacterium GW2011_GWE1_34_7]
MYKLYIGNETHISLLHAKSMVKKLLLESDITYLPIDAEKKQSTEIIEILTSNSLFSDRRVLFLKRIYRNKDKDKLIPFLLEYLEKNEKDNLIIWEDQKVSSATKYVKYFKERKLLEEHNKLNKIGFKKYVKDLCVENNISLNSYLIDVLSEYSNYDTQRIENSIKKLKLLEKETVSEEDIHLIVANTVENDIWKLLDEINSKEGKPLNILENLFKQKIDPLYIIPMIARNLRLITLTKYLLSNNASNSDIASAVKIPPFIVKPLVDTAHRYEWDKIRSRYEKLSNLDYEIKIGRIDARLGLTLFCTIT